MKLLIMFAPGKKYGTFSRHILFSGSILLLFVAGNVFDSFAEEFTISIPFGAYNPTLNTPTDVWYDPPIFTIKIGDTITWSNDDKEGHTVTSGESPGRFGWMSEKQGEFGKPNGIFDSDRFMPGESWTYTFDDVGTFSYFCTFHPWMEGAVTVEQTISDYPHDAFGNKIEMFPAIQ